MACSILRISVMRRHAIRYVARGPPSPLPSVVFLEFTLGALAAIAPALFASRTSLEPTAREATVLIGSLKILKAVAHDKFFESTYFSTVYRG